MSSGYSEEDIRRAAEIREWLIKEISDKQEEVERLRTTLSIIDNLLKQGSFKMLQNLGFGAATSTPAGSRETVATTAGRCSSPTADSLDSRNRNRLQATTTSRGTGCHTHFEGNGG